MADIKATINPQKKIQVTEYKVNTQSISLGDLFDVDTSNSSDGGLLVFSSNTSTYEVKTELDNKNTKINGGHY